jgi:hypothetical protein
VGFVGRLEASCCAALTFGVKLPPLLPASRLRACPLCHICTSASRSHPGRSVWVCPGVPATPGGRRGRSVCRSSAVEVAPSRFGGSSFGSGRRRGLDQPSPWSLRETLLRSGPADPQGSADEFPGHSVVPCLCHGVVQECFRARCQCGELVDVGQPVRCPSPGVSSPPLRVGQSCGEVVRCHVSSV